MVDMPRGMELSAGQFILGILWVFALPIIGLIGGAVLASRWEDSPLLATAAIAGGLATGVAGGVAGRRLTLRVPPVAGIDVQREERRE